MISISDDLSTKSNKPQVAILQDTEGILTCQAGYQISNDVRVRYLDY